MGALRVWAIVLLLSNGGGAAVNDAMSAGPDLVRQRYPTHCVLDAVLSWKGFARRADLALPAVYLESTTPLSRFQEAVASQWQEMPDRFSNVFVVSRNEIYLIDEAEYYRRTRKSIDDSLAHELTHYVQAIYQGFVIDDDPSLEANAVDVQTWFRETYIDASPPSGFCE